MAKRSTVRVGGGTQINITHYGDEVAKSIREAVKEGLVPVLTAMEAEARSLCPVGSREAKERKFSLMAWTGRNYKSHAKSKRRRNWYIYPKKREREIKLHEPRRHESWMTRTPGRLRDSIRSAVHIRKDNAAVVGFLEAGSDDAFYARFVELGTHKMTPRPFLRPAFNRHKATAVVAINRAMEGT